jgi:amidase
MPEARRKPTDFTPFTAAWWDAQRVCGDLPTDPTDGAPLLTAQAEEIEAVRRLSHDLLLISVMTQRPQVTLPVAQTGGLPLGISFLGPRGSDRLLVELAAAFMQGDRNEQ